MTQRIKMKRYFSRLVLFNLIVLSTLSFVQADTLETKDGRILQGKYMGGTQQSVRFQTETELMTVATSELLALSFTTTPAAATVPTVATVPAAATVPAVSVPVSAAGPVTIPAGTVILVTTTSQLSSEDAPGRKFSATLGSNMMVGSVVVAPKGTTVYGQVGKTAQAGRMAGKSELELYLTEIEINGIRYPLMTTNYAQAGKNSFSKTARNVGVGALIGAVVDNDDSAKKGAAIGTGVSAIRKGDAIVVPAGSMLEFRMTQPLTVTQ